MAARKKPPTSKYLPIKPGAVFNSWTVLGPAVNEPRNEGCIQSAFFWRCRCKCGVHGNVRTDKLNGGASPGCVTCGGVKRGNALRTLPWEDRTDHPMAPRFVQMMRRCYDSRVISYQDYGGRGITVCKRWRDPVEGFRNYVADMGEGPPFEGASIDRIDNDKGYSPKNCRWADKTVQSNNRRQRSDGGLWLYRGKNYNRAELAKLLSVSWDSVTYHLVQKRRSVAEMVFILRG